MSWWFCSNCGRTRNDGGIFCPACGRAMFSAAFDPTSADKNYSENKKLNFDMEKNFEWNDNMAYELIRYALKDRKSFYEENTVREVVLDFKHKYSPKKNKYPEGILSFKRNIQNSDPNFADVAFFDKASVPYVEWIQRCFNDSMHILTVKNSSGEILTVGDETNFGKIFCFKIFEDQILVGTKKERTAEEFFRDIKTIGITIVDSPVSQNMNDVHPVKSAEKNKYRTEDGFDIAEGFWTVSDFKLGAFYEDMPAFFIKDSLLFHDQKAAEKYIDDNRPLFSKIEDAIVSREKMNPSIQPDDRVITLFKSKLGL